MNQNLQYDYNIKSDLNPIEINENSSFGAQLKHYRQAKGIHQKDIAKYVDIDRYGMYCMENKEYKQIFDPNNLKKIIDFLDINDKLVWNDKYIDFVLNQKYYLIDEFIKMYDLKLYEFCELMDGIALTTARNWITGKSIMSRRMYNRFIEVCNKYKNHEIKNDTTEYIDFLNNNPKKEFLLYIRKEKITMKEFANRLDRDEISIRKMINGETKITKKQFLKFKKLQELQKSGEINSDSYIVFINSNYPKTIKNFIKKYKLSSEKLANELGVSKTTIDRWRNSKAKITRDNYYKLIEVMNKYKKRKNDYPLKSR